MSYLMKGKHWSDRHKFRVPLQYPVVVQPKVDEIRVRVLVNSQKTGVTYLSYAEKPLYNLGFADALFLRLSNWFGMRNFDCGFLCNNNFDDSRSFVRSSKNFPERLRHASRVFLLYDIPDAAAEYIHRIADIAEICNTAEICNMAPIDTELRMLPHWIANTPEGVEYLYESLRAQQYEGAMIKTLSHKYQIGKRSQDWLKMKPEDTADGKIVGFVEASATVPIPSRGVKIGDPLGRVGSVIVKLEDGTEARPHGIAHELGAEMLANPSKYLGEWCEFAFMERDTQGGYRHPVFRRIRDAKD